MKKEDDVLEFGEYKKRLQKDIKKRKEIREEADSATCDVCEGILVKKGYSPEPSVCKECYERMVRGGRFQKNDEDDEWLDR